MLLPLFCAKLMPCHVRKKTFLHTFISAWLIKSECLIVYSEKTSFSLQSFVGSVRENGAQFSQGAINKPYFFSAGVIGQHALVTPPVTTPPQQIPHPGTVGALTRLPIGVEQLASPVHPNSGVPLVRPVPQQASPVRVS